MNDLFEKSIDLFESRNKNFKVLHGGDGTLVSEWRNNRKKCLLPIRNYGMCEKHAKLYDDFLNCRGNIELRQFLFPTIKLDLFNNSIDTEALSEIVFMNKDITQCMRINLYINGKTANENVICSGLIFATKLGSTGYFKSVARTIFRDGIGIAFISPTYSIPNIIVSNVDDISVEFVRSTDVCISCDKMKYERHMDKEDVFLVNSASNNIPIFGYDHFMCEECRRNRNSTIVNDSYMIG